MASVTHPLPSRMAQNVAALYGHDDDTLIAWQRACVQAAEALRPQHDPERLTKALALAQGGHVALEDTGYALVTSGTKRYQVQADGTCDCPDSQHRGVPCKHVLAVLIHARAEEWRASQKLTAPHSGWSDADYRQAAALVAQDLSSRVGHRALATGLAVAVAQRRLSDAAAIIAGSAEIQVDSLASLGLRPTARGWLHAGRAAATGLLFATYVDVEERFEVKLAVQAAAFGLEGLGDVFELTGDLVSDTAEEVFSETVGAAGGVVGTAGALLGVSLGVSGNLAQQVAEFITKVGADIAEGVVIASVLHYHGMFLVAAALALNEEHRAELAPRLVQFQ